MGKDDTHICSIESVRLLLGYLFVDDCASRRGWLMLASWDAGSTRCSGWRKSASCIDRVCDDWASARLFVVGHGLRREDRVVMEEKEVCRLSAMCLLFSPLIVPHSRRALFGQSLFAHRWDTAAMQSRAAKWA